MSKRVEKLAVAYQKVFDSPEGKLVLSDIYKYTNTHDSTFDPSNPYVTSFNEGMRRVGLRIFSYVNMAPEEVRRISKQQEQQEEEVF